MKNTKGMVQEIPAIVEKKDFINWSLKFSIAQQWALKIMDNIYLSIGKYYSIPVLDEEKLHLFTKNFQGINVWETTLKEKDLVLYMQLASFYRGELEEIKENKTASKVNAMIEKQIIAAIDFLIDCPAEIKYPGDHFNHFKNSFDTFESKVLFEDIEWLKKYLSFFQWKLDKATEVVKFFNTYNGKKEIAIAQYGEMIYFSKGVLKINFDISDIKKNSSLVKKAEDLCKI